MSVKADNIPLNPLLKKAEAADNSWEKNVVEIVAPDDSMVVENKKKTKKTFRKDSGWSWLILAAAFFIQMIDFGIVLCFGIYFVTLMDYFQCTKRDVALVGSICYGIKNITAILSSVMFRKYGCRIVVIAGGFISSAGCFLSYFAQTLHHLYITFGLIVGFGLGLVYTPTIGIIPDYFEKYRFFATAFVTVGSACGTLVCQPIFLYLIKAYTWRGSMMIMACFALQMIPLGSLLKSRQFNPAVSFASMFETSLFGMVEFWWITVGGLLWGGSIYIVYSMCNALVMTREVSRDDSAILASLLGFSSVIGRSGSAIIGHSDRTNRRLFFTVLSLLIGVSILLTIFAWSFWTFAATLGLFGLTFGGMLSQLPSVLIETFGVHRLVNVLGYYLFAVGVGGLSFPFMAGYLADLNTVVTAFQLACGIQFISFSCAAIGFIYHQFTVRNRQSLS